MTMTGQEILDAKAAILKANADKADLDISAAVALPLDPGTDYSITEASGRIHGFYAYKVTPVDENDDGDREVSCTASVTRAQYDAAPQEVKDWLVKHLETFGELN